ncbi:sensor histidine kinase [Paenisporosarcina antarctica]|uniref:histidine kinase n=1 Tax=Paenisporosarcina antarctica TaxID=417367 RepID=A0A4P7A1F3_9BACL|nr:sensor histidine kinase [Paenisporosarcina antarctica]QBP42672.1 sensor histidine kinase [Paenisporosarcina antarctica]
MNSEFKKTINLFTTILVIGATVLLLLHTTEFSFELCLLSFTYIFLLLIRDYMIKIDLHRIIGVLFLFFQLALALVIFVWSGSFFAQVFVLILIGEFTLHHSRNLSLFFTIVSYTFSLISLMAYRNFPPFEQIYVFLPRVIEYFAIFGMSYLAQITFHQKNQLARDHALLQKSSIELEEKSILQERTRISREIHDSVGHTLTSAIVGLQSASHAIEKKHYSLAIEMIRRTKAHISSGLDDVRSSVYLLREDPLGPQFIPELIKLIDETKKQTNVEIECEVDTTVSNLSSLIEITLYRALQEGLTNGIRHGSSTYFHFSLTQYSDYIEFILSNNGKSPIQIVHGFGLKTMKERVTDVGGKLSISNKFSANGVTLKIKIPIQAKSTGQE